MRLKASVVGAVLVVALCPLTLSATGPEKTHWNLGEFSWVKRVPAESGAVPNAQPISLSAEGIQALLGPLRAVVDGQEESLFTRDELKGLTSALSEALALAQPGEDLVLVSSVRRGRTFSRAEGLTARLFVQDGALQIIVHDARLAFMDRWLEETIQPTFVYGSRQMASETVLQASGATRRRPDWLALPLALVQPRTPAPAPAPISPLVSAAPPAQAVAPIPATQEAATYEAKAQRLRNLKRLREENLISETEYQEKREAILKTL